MNNMNSQNHVGYNSTNTNQRLVNISQNNMMQNLSKKPDKRLPGYSPLSANNLKQKMVEKNNTLGSGNQFNNDQQRQKLDSSHHNRLQSAKKAAQRQEIKSETRVDNSFQGNGKFLPTPQVHHQKMMTATFNQDNDLVNKAQFHPQDTRKSVPGASNHLVSRNQRQNDPNANKIVSHALTAHQNQLNGLFMNQNQPGAGFGQLRGSKNGGLMRNAVISQNINSMSMHGENSLGKGSQSQTGQIIIKGRSGKQNTGSLPAQTRVSNSQSGETNQKATVSNKLATSQVISPVYNSRLPNVNQNFMNNGGNITRVTSQQNAQNGSSNKGQFNNRQQSIKQTKQNKPHGLSTSQNINRNLMSGGQNAADYGLQAEGQLGVKTGSYQQMASETGEQNRRESDVEMQAAAKFQHKSQNQLAAQKGGPKMKDNQGSIREQAKLLNPMQNRRNPSNNADQQYFSERAGNARPASSTLNRGDIEGSGRGTTGNPSTGVRNTKSGSGNSNYGSVKHNQSQFHQNGQNMILNKYLSNQGGKQAAPKSLNQDGQKSTRSISQRSQRKQDDLLSGKHRQSEANAANAKRYEQYNSQPSPDRPMQSESSPNKARTLLNQRNTPKTALKLGAQNQMNMDYASQRATTEEAKPAFEFGVGPGLDNRSADEGNTNNATAKSRNQRPAPGGELAALSSTDQVFFNSNREKSPTIGASDSTQGSLQQRVVSSARRTPFGSQAPVAPSTGETGHSEGGSAPNLRPRSNTNRSAAGKKASPANNKQATPKEQSSHHTSRLSQTPTKQNYLANNKGEYDQVIQECEREMQQRQKQLMHQTSNIIDAFHQGLQPDNNFLGPQEGTIPPANPLKDFEDAKYASKSHGLITSYSANTHQGIQRNYNEDRVSIILNMTRPEKKDPATWPKCSFFAIYDGHGGSTCADYLKDHLHQIIITQPCFPEDPRKALHEGCRIAEEKFLAIADQGARFDKAGSCAIIVLTVEKECYIANVGDSRALLSVDSGMKIFDLSQDHRPNEEAEFYRIQDNGGQVYQTQTFQNVPITNKYGQVTGTQRQMLYGPYRVLPGRLSVSRTFGDIEAKFEKFGGKPGVVSAVPEISQFTIDENTNDFIVLGCDGIYDRLTTINVVDSAWSAMATALKQAQKIDSTASVQRKPLTIHQVSGKMSDAILKSSAVERSYDNLTVVIIAFKNLQTFYEKAKKKDIRKTQTIKIEGEHSPRSKVDPIPIVNNKLGFGSNVVKDKDNGYQTTKQRKTKDLINTQLEQQQQKTGSANRNGGSVSSNRSGRNRNQSGAAQQSEISKRTSNSTQQERDNRKNQIAAAQQNSLASAAEKLKAEQQNLLQRKKSSDSNMRGATPTSTNKYNSRDKESRNKKYNASTKFNSLYGHQDGASGSAAFGGAAAAAFSGNNTAAPSMGVGPPLSLGSRNRDVNGTNPASFYKSNKEQLIQNVKYQNQMLLKQQQQMDQQNNFGAPSNGNSRLPGHSSYNTLSGGLQGQK